MQHFTLAGLQGLRGIDPDFNVMTEEDDIVLTLDDSEIASARLLGPTDSPQEWADLATSLVLYAKASGTLSLILS